LHVLYTFPLPWTWTLLERSKNSNRIRALPRSIRAFLRNCVSRSSGIADTILWSRPHTVSHHLEHRAQLKTVPPIIAVLLPCGYFYPIEQFCSCRENRRYPDSLTPLISALISLLMNIHSIDAICEFALSIAWLYFSLSLSLSLSFFSYCFFILICSLCVCMLYNYPGR